jgi:hypothetical protein
MADFIDGWERPTQAPPAPSGNRDPPSAARWRRRLDTVEENIVGNSDNQDIARLFRSALVHAESLVAMARCDSAEAGWRSAGSACDALEALLNRVDSLLFAPDVREHLALCPPTGCTPDGAELAGLKLYAVSWHHLARDLAHYVALKVTEQVIGLDTVFLFAELDNDNVEYLPVESDDDVQRFEAKLLKSGEKRAGRLAEALQRIRDDGQRCWPEMAEVLRQTGLTSNHFERVWAGVRREWLEIERQRLSNAPNNQNASRFMACSRAEAFIGYLTDEIRILKDACNGGELTKAMESALPRYGKPPALQLCELAVTEVTDLGHRDVAPLLNELWLTYFDFLDSAAGGSIDNAKVATVFDGMNKLRALLPAIEAARDRTQPEPATAISVSHQPPLAPNEMGSQIPREAETPLPFSGGTMVFFADRVCVSKLIAVESAVSERGRCGLRKKSPQRA